MIHAQGVVKSFGTSRALNGIDLQLEQGKAYGVVGPNGCGKTTFFRLITGLLRPDADSISVLGKSPTELDRSNLGYMPQSESLYNDLSVEENVRFFAEVCGLAAKDCKERVDEVLALTKLQPHRKKLVEQLSGGMIRRTSLCCAISHRPALLLLDEPTVGVDPRLRLEFWDYFSELKQSGTTILVSTHHLDEASRCDELVLLLDGMLLAKMSPSDLLESTQADSIEEAFLQLSEQEAQK